VQSASTVLLGCDYNCVGELNCSMIQCGVVRQRDSEG